MHSCRRPSRTQTTGIPGEGPAHTTIRAALREHDVAPRKRPRKEAEKNERPHLHPWPDRKHGPVSRWASPDRTRRLGSPAPGNPTLTRRMKEAGDHWIVQEKRGRKTLSRGVWAPAGTIKRLRADLEAERATEGYARTK